MCMHIYTALVYLSTRNVVTEISENLCGLFINIVANEVVRRGAKRNGGEQGKGG